MSAVVCLSQEARNVPLASLFSDPPIRALLDVCSGHRALERRLTVLIFHRVLSEPDLLFPNEMHAARFDRLCANLARWFNVLPLNEAVERLPSRTLPKRPMAITFDDGYADNHDVALPILKRHGLSATFFVATSFLGDGCMFNDCIVESIRRTGRAAIDPSEFGLPGRGTLTLRGVAERRRGIEALLEKIKYLDPDERTEVVERLAVVAGVPRPRGLMMTPDQVNALSRSGMTIGAHTRTHPILSGLSASDARDEIVGSRSDLEAITGRRIELFAYPNGKPGVDYSRESVDIARQAGFAAAVSTAPGAASAGSDLFQLPRYTPWQERPSTFALSLARNFRGAPQVLT